MVVAPDEALRESENSSRALGGRPAAKKLTAES
jgi:hypothetical protein